MILSVLQIWSRIFLRYELNYPLILSRVMRKPFFAYAKNKDADQLRSNCVADQHLCFRYIDSAIPLLS